MGVPMTVAEGQVEPRALCGLCMIDRIVVQLVRHDVTDRPDTRQRPGSEQHNRAQVDRPSTKRVRQPVEPSFGFELHLVVHGAHASVPSKAGKSRHRAARLGPPAMGLVGAP